MAEKKPISVQRPGGAGHGPGGGPGRHGYQKPKDLKGTLTKLMRYLGRYKAALCLVAVLLVISSACTVGGSYLIKPLINDYILPGDFPGLAKMLAFMGCVYVVGAACSFGYARIMVHVSQNTVAKIRSDLFDRMQSLPLKYFDTHTHGELMSRYTNDIETVSEALNNSFGSLISCTLNFVGTIAMMIVLSPVLSLITFVMLAVMLAVYSLYQYLLKPGRIFDRDPMLHREVRFRFNGEDIARQDSEVAVLLDWRVSKVWRNRDFYFLFEGKESYILLPRWAFGSAEEEKQFERLVLVANPGVAWRNFG